MLFAFKEKDYTYHVQGPDRDKIFSFVLKQRINDEYWYLGPELDKAKKALQDGLAYEFMLSRSYREYENFHEIQVEVID